MTILKTLSALTGDENARLEVLEDRLAIARDAAARAWTDLGSANLAVEEGEADGEKRKQRAEREFETATKRVADLEAAIEAARIRASERTAEAEAQEAAKAWDATVAHADVRLAAAQDAEKAIAALEDAARRLKEANANTMRDCPDHLDLDGALLRAPEIDMLLRLQMVKAGFSWAAKWPWGPESIPPLSHRIANANAYVESRRAGG